MRQASDRCANGSLILIGKAARKLPFVTTTTTIGITNVALNLTLGSGVSFDDVNSPISSTTLARISNHSTYTGV